MTFFSTPKTTGDTFDGCKAYNRSYAELAKLSYKEAISLLGDNSTDSPLTTTETMSCGSGPYDWNIGAGMHLSLANQVRKVDQTGWLD